MKLSISTALYHNTDYKKIFEVLTNSGFRTIELFLMRLYPSLIIEEVMIDDMIMALNDILEEI